MCLTTVYDELRSRVWWKGSNWIIQMTLTYLISWRKEVLRNSVGLKFEVLLARRYPSDSKVGFVFLAI